VEMMVRSRRWECSNRHEFTDTLFS
jgi:hypothetical protein